MTYKLQLLLCFFLLSLGASAQNIPSYVPTNGLVGYWPFNGNANDESGNGNHGILLNGVTLSNDRLLNLNSSFAIDGIDGLNKGIKIPVNLTGTEYTTSIWFMISDSTKGGGTSSQTIICAEPFGVMGCGFNHPYFPNNMGSCIGDSYNWNICSGGMSNTWQLQNKQSWHLLTIIKTFVEYRYYIDGILKRTQSIGPSNSVFISEFYLGAIRISSGEVFKGKLDDIAIYNRALTQQEITALYTGVPPCTPTSSTTNLSIPSTSLPYTWNGLTFNNSGSQTATLTNSKGCDSTATLNLTVTNTIPSYVPTNGLVGYWPFNGNANDESGNGNHGTVNGATLTSDRNGGAGKAYSFDGVNDFIKCNYGGPSGNPVLTLSFWIKSSQSTYGHLIGYGSNAGSGQDIRVFINGNCSNSIAFDTYDNQKAKSTMFSNEWDNYTIIYNGNLGNNTTVSSFYKNGVLMITECFNVNISSTNISSLFPIVFGRYHGTAQTGFYNGLLDDVMIYNRLLTQQEITALYSGVPPCTPTSSTTNLSIPSTSLPFTWNGLTFNNSGSQTATLTNAKGCDSAATLNLTVTNTIPNYVPTNGLVGYWPFNGNANDESGNGNHGTVHTGTTLSSDRNNVPLRSYEIDGINCFTMRGIELPAELNQNTDYTINIWFKSNDPNKTNQTIFNTFPHNVIDVTIFSTWPSQPNTMCSWIGNGTYPWLIDGNNCYWNFSNYTQWHHLVVIKTSSKIDYYVDNNLSKSQIAPNNFITNQLFHLIVGGINLNADNSSLCYASFKGKLDDIAIYNRALTQQEITQLYTGTVTHSIDASSGTNGTISPSGSTSINSGASQAYTFTPNSGYWIDSVIVNGIKVPTASSYTFSNVTSNQNIRVTYRSLAAALAAANICANDTTVATVNLPATSLVRATTYYSNIYLFNQNNSGNAYMYNVNDRKYTAIADKPTPCVECGVAEANGKIYCFNTNGTTQAYDIASNTWQTITNQPNSSTSSVYAVSINNKVYVLGTNANNQNTFIQYNPQNNTYTAQATPNQQSSQSRLVAYNNLIYKIGGINTATNTTSTAVEVYNPSNNTWTNLPDLPEALSHVGATNYDNKLYVFGGKQSNANTTNPSNSNKVYVFDIAGNTWYAQSNTLNYQRANIEAKTANNLVYLFGGTDTSSTATNQANRYFCKDQLCTCKWAEYVCNGVSSDNPCPTSSLYRPGTVFCNGYATKVVEVTNPTTGKTWMDRNLGASRVATSSTDSLAYGDLYQWGRGADGHQCRNSTITSTLSSTDQPGHGNFIITNSYPWDWRMLQNDKLWQEGNGINNPCPTGYRLPTSTELEAERISWSQNNYLGAFGALLKLPVAGCRVSVDGSLSFVGSYGYYWSSTKGTPTSILDFGSGGASLDNFGGRAFGFSVRCIKD
jgi:hypothetical protein